MLWSLEKKIDQQSDLEPQIQITIKDNKTLRTDYIFGLRQKSSLNRPFQTKEMKTKKQKKK